MKWRIRKDNSAMPDHMWRADGWTWNEEHGEWLRVVSWRRTWHAALADVQSLGAPQPRPVEEAPC